MIAVLGNGRDQDNGQSVLSRTLRQIIDDLRAENERLKERDGSGGNPADSGGSA